MVPRRRLRSVAYDRGDAEQAAAYARELLEIWREPPPNPTWWARIVREEMERLESTYDSLPR